MSWLLFLDESGHDHNSMPYEVRGGIALQDMEVWPFVQEVQRLELASFGVVLHQFRTELKGCKLLDGDRFKWASQGPLMAEDERRKHCRGFLTKGLEKSLRNATSLRHTDRPVSRWRLAYFFCCVTAEPSCLHP